MYQVKFKGKDSQAPYISIDNALEHVARGIANGGKLSEYAIFEKKRVYTEVEEEVKFVSKLVVVD